MRRITTLTALLFIVTTASFAQDITYRLLNYNMLQYDTDSDNRNAAFSLIMSEIQPHLILAQEIGSYAGAQAFVDEVLDPATWATSAPYQTGYSEEFLFYRSDLFEIIDHHSVPTDLRNHELYWVQATEVPGQPVVILGSTHLKASQDGSNRRYLEVMDLVAHMDDHDLHNANFLIAGDMNLYTSSEAAYQAFLNDGEFEDPIDTPGSWHDNAAFAHIHTQSPLTYGPGVGGMDDRFDFILAQPVLFDEAGWDVDAATYTAFGNDGNHFNGAINDGPNDAVSPEVANALCDASDHLPVFVDLVYYLPDGELILTLLPAVDHPVLLPSGGTLEFDARVSNLTDTMITCAGWTSVILPNGNPYGPLLLRPAVHLPASQTLTIPMQQVIPAAAPGGEYVFIANLGVFPNPIDATSQFHFSKLGN